MGHCCAVPNCKAHSKRHGTNRTFHSFPKDPARRRLWELAIKRPNFTANDHSKVCSKHFTPESFETAKFGGTWLKRDALPTLFDFEEEPKRPRKRRRKSIPQQGESPVSATPTTQESSPKTTTEKGKSPAPPPGTHGKSVESWNKALLELHRNPPTKPGESPDESWNKALLELHKKTLTDRGLSHDESLNEVSCAAIEEMHRKRLKYFGDFDETDMKSPEKAQKFLEISREEVAKNKKVIRKLRVDNKRLLARVNSLKDKLAELKKKKTPKQIEHSSPGLKFIDRLQNPNSKEQYPNELKALSLNLYSYSPTAYIHVRRNFQYKLPHPATVRKWTRDIHIEECNNQTENCECEACRVEAAEACNAETEVCDCDECNAEACNTEECDAEDCNDEDCNAEECDDAEDCDVEDCDTEECNVDGSNAEDCNAAAYIAEVCYTEECTSERCYTEL